MFLSYGQMRKSCCRCSSCRARVWYDKRFVFPICFLNSLSNVSENLSRRSFRTRGGSVKCGGVQLDQTYILGSYVSSEEVLIPAKWKRRWIARWNLGMEVSFSLFHVFVQRGVGINLSPRPNKERRFFAGCFCCVKSWNAK